MHESQVFANSLKLATPGERAAYLDEVCAGNPGLRADVEALLRAHVQDPGFLEQPVGFLGGTPGAPAPGEPRAEPDGTEEPGVVLAGRYKLLEQIGEGGMGTVWMAQQIEPVKRLVAVKLMKVGLGSKAVLARFKAERQALALMDHPNIARVLDAGAAPDGRPFFVMELVKGVPITRYCDKHCLTPRQRLELFVPVCQAVQHAHHKGIIHRDLKPSNILVALYDDRPDPKVIDFGVAKAAGQQLTEQTLHTGFGAVVGTFEYMSPEQASFNQLDVDARSDIYALGVLLYELLTGDPPFTRKELEKVGMLEMLRVIREREPSRPSTKLSTADRLPTLAANRRTEPKRLAALVRRELDWIVMKALEKDRNRRYETASAFAADVQHFLNDEPVQACPPSRWYRLRKLARRNKATVAMVSVFVLAVLLAVVTLAVSNFRIREEQERSREEKVRAEQAQRLAEARAEEIRDGLERLKTAGSLLERSRWYIAETRWDDAHAELTRAVRLRPDLASAWVQLGDLHTHLGLWEFAADDFAHELAVRPADSTGRWYQLALLRHFLGDSAGYQEVVRKMRARFRGTPHAFFLTEVVRASALEPDPEADREQLVELAQHAKAHSQPDWYMIYILGLAHYRAGQHEQAVRWLQTSLATNYPEILSANHSLLAMAHHRMGQAAEARQALKVATQKLDQWTDQMYRTPQDRRWLQHLGAAPVWPLAWWDWLECRVYYREAKLLIDGSPPSDDPRVHVLSARAFAGIRAHGRAEREYAAALRRLPEDPRIRLEAHRNRGYGCIQFRQWKKVAAEFAEAGELQPDDPYYLLFSAVAHLAAGELDAYRQRCATLVQRFEITTDPEIAGKVLLACVLRSDAIPDMGRLLPLARVATPSEHFGPPETGAAYYRAGKYDAAVRCFEAAAKTYRPRALAWCFLAMAHHRLGHAGEARRALTEAARWIAEADGGREEDPAATRASWGAWHEPLECRLLFKEAKQLLGQENSSRGFPTGRRIEGRGDIHERETSLYHACAVWEGGDPTMSSIRDFIGNFVNNGAAADTASAAPPGAASAGADPAAVNGAAPPAWQPPLADTQTAWKEGYDVGVAGDVPQCKVNVTPAYQQAYDAGYNAGKAQHDQGSGEPAIAPETPEMREGAQEYEEQQKELEPVVKFLTGAEKEDPHGHEEENETNTTENPKVQFPPRPAPEMPELEL